MPTPLPPALRALLLAALAAAVGPTSAQDLASQSPPLTATVRDSVRMTLTPIHYNGRDEAGRAFCGAYVQATWPNVLQDLLGRSDRTYGYRDYSLVATEGMFVPRGYGQISPDDLPPGTLGHHPQLGGGAAALGPGGPALDCSDTLEYVESVISGTWVFLNAAPFRITEWYAVYSVPSGTPVALFEWEQGEPLAIEFDASFESEQSREVDADAPGGKRPVASYDWDFGDGESGSGARPTHTYSESGDYVVRLTVTDDDGETNSREDSVRVEAAQLTVSVETLRPEATRGDTVEVVATVTNTGVEGVFEVRALRQFAHAPEYPEEYNIAGAQFNGPTLTAVPLEDGEPEAVERGGLQPGESMEVRRRYSVDQIGRVREGYSGPFTDIPSEVTSALIQVTAETVEGRPVPVLDECEDGGCSDVTEFAAPEYTVQIVPGSGPVVSTGLRPAAAGRIEDVRFVRYESAEGGLRPVCENGCTDLIVRVLDEDGEPADDVEVEVTVTLESFVALDGVPPGFACERVLLGEAGPCATLGQPLSVRTDAEGTARVWAAIPAGELPEERPDGSSTTVQAEAAIAIPGGDRDDLSLGVQEGVIFRTEQRVSPASARLIALTHGIGLGAGTVSIGNWCEALVNAGRDRAFDAVSLTQYQKNVLQMGGAAVIGAWICSVGVDLLGSASPVVDALGQIDNLADPTKKVTDILQFTWFAQEYGVDNASDLIVLQAPLPKPVIAWFQGDALDVADGIAGYALGQSFSSARSMQTLLMQETTGLSRPSGPTSKSDFDPSRFDGRLRVLWREMDSAPTPTLNMTASFGYTPVQTDVISFGSEGFLVGNPSLIGSPGARRAARASDHVGTTEETSAAGATELVVGAWDGDAGEYLVVGEGTMTPEVVQVRTVTAGGADRTILALTTPLRYAQPEGAAVERIAPGTVAPPAPPVLRPHLSAARPDVLAWGSFPTDLASGYDVEVTADTTAGEAGLLVNAEGVTADSLSVDPETFELATAYAWRVRATNEVGAGEWSPWSEFVTTAAVPTGPGPAQLPAEVALGVPSPNPARSRAVVSVELPEAGPVRVVVFDALGRAVATVRDGPMGAGRHALEVDTSSLPSGLYVVRLTTGAAADAQRLTVVR